MAGKGMPPGASQGISGTGGLPSLAGHTPGPVGVAKPGKELAGHTAMNIGAIAPCDEHPAPVHKAAFALGHVPD